MSVINKIRRLTLLGSTLCILLVLSGCSEALPAIYPKAPLQPVVRKFNLSAQQGLRDIAGDFSSREQGADTGITVLPGEKVEIFATGSAQVQSGVQSTGPEGNRACRDSRMPEPSLPCYAVIYSIGLTGRAGVVGTHAGFQPTQIGNIFLGVNASTLTGNSGVFHMTVLIIPAGKLAGLWATPTNDFIVQGTSTKLSVYVFAQNASITMVEFIAPGSPGRAPTSICTARPVGADLYACEWNLQLTGERLHNGRVSIGFRVQGAAKQSDNAIVNPDGVRNGVVRYTKHFLSENYAGYAATDLDGTVAYQKVTGRWTVPQVSCSPGETSDAGIWVGMSNNKTNTSLLAQLGTDSGCLDGSPLYSMWWEMFPAPPVMIDGLVLPGDSITTSVTFSNSQFQLVLDNPRQGVHFSTLQQGKVSDTSYAECITEAPFFVDNVATNSGYIAPLTNFGMVKFSCQMNNGQPIADGPQNILFQMNTPNGTPKAIISDLDATGTTFTVQWNHT